MRRVGRWRKRALWMWRKLNALPRAVRIIVFAATVLAVFSATNLVYHVVRKPTEVFAPVSGAADLSLHLGDIPKVERTVSPTRLCGAVY